ncbi:putative cell survival pathways protein [Neonectria punicea]|uniref:Cell survival pathways protein n=1 Tax=Neonectria punicea TaxID=979145 RepID=A0ABR1HC93_9HYPO
MFNWAKQQIAYVAGTQEPVYGPEALRSVAVEAEETPFTELKREDLTWAAMQSTCVETQIFYAYSKAGHVAFFEIIYSNVVYEFALAPGLEERHADYRLYQSGLRTTCQFLCKLFYPENQDPKTPPLWTSTQLSGNELSNDYVSFFATDCKVELSEDGSSYKIESSNDDRAVVDLTVSRVAPGFLAGTTGNTYFGTDPENPWGSMRHTFWPRCVATGSIKTGEEVLADFYNDHATFIHALQGMKPHHAAARWNFVNFHGPEYSAVMMEFTTPESYGSTVVNVGCIANNDGIVVAGCNGTATHTASKDDPVTGWEEPTEARYTWSGTDTDGKAVEAVIEGPLNRTDCVDIMAEVPGFIKTIISGAVGTRPYLYQFRPNLELKLKIGDEEVVEEGGVYAEATFIS